VVVLGAISLFTDMAGEMIVPLRLIFLVQVLATPLPLAGLIEGTAEGATSLLKIVAGRLANREGARRGLILWGYAVSNLAKPLLALAANWPIALGLILVDRGGKAVRGSPRDAMLADAVAPSVVGKAFGFHRGADTLGAALGPLLALVVLAATAGQVRAVFAWTLLPGVLAVLVGLVCLRERRAAAGASETAAGGAAASPGAGTLASQRLKPRRFPLAAFRHAVHFRGGHRPRRFGRRGASGLDRVKGHWSTLRLWNLSPRRGGSRGRVALGFRFWLFTATATCFALGNSSDAFLFLRSEGLEASLIAVPLLYFAFNLVYALLATPLGSLSDRRGRLPVLAAGYAAFTLVYLGWTRASVGWQGWALFLLYGVYYAATEGVARAFVTDLVPRDQRGAALGWFNGLIGIAALPANIVGAWLWAQWGPSATFGMGAWLGAVALGLLVAWWPWLRQSSRTTSG
jgi:predicted MFS family arabinose efflux permease